MVSFSRMYDGAYGSPECPPDKVIEDDDMFDGWLIDQRRTREKEQSVKRAEAAGNWKDSAKKSSSPHPRKKMRRMYMILMTMTAG